MKNKCLLVLLLALGCCHVQAQKSQKDPLSEALVRLNQKVDSELIPEIKRFPLIGISTDISPKRTAVNTAYVQSVILSGGIPYMIPVTDNVEILRQIVSRAGAYFFQFFIKKVAIIHWLDVFSTCKDNSVQSGYNLT